MEEHRFLNSRRCMSVCLCSMAKPGMQRDIERRIEGHICKWSVGIVDIVSSQLLCRAYGYRCTCSETLQQYQTSICRVTCSWKGHKCRFCRSQHGTCGDDNTTTRRRADGSLFGQGPLTGSQRRPGLNPSHRDSDRNGKPCSEVRAAGPVQRWHHCGN